IDFKKLTSSKKEYQHLRKTIREYAHFFSDPTQINNNIPKFQKKSRHLYQLLQIPKAQKLIIIPDGILSFVPFQTLLTDKSKTHQYENMPFLIRKSTVSYRLSLRNYTR